MKRLVSSFIAAAIVIFSCPAVHAQGGSGAASYPRHEIGLSYGVLPNSEVITAFVDIFAGLSKAVIEGMFGAGEKTSYDNTVYVGPLTAEYFYNTSRVVGVGGMFISSYETSDVMHDGAKVGSRNRNCYSLMPAVKLNWFRKPVWGMYSKIGAGVSVFHWREHAHNPDNDKSAADSDGPVIFNFQLSAAGIEVGRKVRGYAEVGVGEQGLISGGIRYRF